MTQKHILAWTRGYKAFLPRSHLLPGFPLNPRISRQRGKPYTMGGAGQPVALLTGRSVGFNSRALHSVFIRFSRAPNWMNPAWACQSHRQSRCGPLVCRSRWFA